MGQEMGQEEERRQEREMGKETEGRVEKVVPSRQEQLQQLMFLQNAQQPIPLHLVNAHARSMPPTLAAIVGSTVELSAWAGLKQKKRRRAVGYGRSSSSSSSGDDRAYQVLDDDELEDKELEVSWRTRSWR